MSATTANVDHNEVAKFDVTHAWWDEHGDYRTLHQINPLRREWMLRYTGPLEGLKVLDVGCGGGILAESLAELGAEVTAIDMGNGPIEAAKAHAEQSGLNIDYRVMSVEELAAEAAGTFDMVSCMEMLEHVPDPVAIVQACAELAKPSGHLFFSTLNRNPKSWLLAIVAAEYVMNMVPRGTHDYARFIRPSELRQWCAQSGLNMDAIGGIEYNPFTRQFDHSNSVDVNYMVHAQPRD